MKIQQIIDIPEIGFKNNNKFRRRAKKNCQNQASIDYYDNEAGKYFLAGLIICVIHLLAMMIFSKNATRGEFVTLVAIMSLLDIWFFIKCIQKKLQANHLRKLLIKK